MTERRLLLVDPNGIDRDMLGRRLARRGYAVDESTNGAEALERIRRDRPSLVLLDTSLPGLDGLALTRALKADAATREIPVVVVTAHAMAQNRELALAAGCDGFETKPIAFDRLLATVEALLDGR